MRTFGQHLVNEILPTEHHDSGALNKGNLNKILLSIAKNTPEQYSDVVTRLKRLGDELVTLEGVSTGLEDVKPDKVKRDALLNPLLTRFNAAKTEEAKKDILLEANSKMIEYTKANKGTLAEMVRSGGRGNAAQLMKIIGSPISARDEHDNVLPVFINRSYSEGLRPAQSWITGNEARLDTIRSNIAVSDPGDLAKILVNNVGDQLITRIDCGTHNGVVLHTDDSHIIDRYLAHPIGSYAYNTAITPHVAQELHTLSPTAIVRSPMTCEQHEGVCQKCAGLNQSGHAHPIGTNIGMRSAQAMAEPLTQFALSAKHGGNLAKSKERTVEGLKGVRQLLEIPESFLYKSILAGQDGTIKKIDPAPQGGTYVHVDDTKHYVGPDLSVIVGIGDRVEAGDRLSNGIPKPDEVVEHKGLGAGRQYMVDALHSIYKEKGTELDKRHFETLAKGLMNYVRIVNTPTDNDFGFLKDDVVSYNSFKRAIQDQQKPMSTHDAIGETLANNVLHFTAGTPITHSMQQTLLKQNIQTVPIAQNVPEIEPIMRTAARNPLLNPDWMARLAHRYLKDTILSGAHKGESSELHGVNAVPAYASGSEFGQGEDGKY